MQHVKHIVNFFEAIKNGDSEAVEANYQKMDRIQKIIYADDYEAYKTGHYDELKMLIKNRKSGSNKSFMDKVAGVSGVKVKVR